MHNFLYFYIFGFDNILNCFVCILYVYYFLWLSIMIIYVAVYTIYNLTIIRFF